MPPPATVRRTKASPTAQEKRKRVVMSSPSSCSSYEESEEEDDSSDEDYVDVSDDGDEEEEVVDVDDEGSDDDDEREEEEEDESVAGNPKDADASCSKITNLLQRGKSMDALKLQECKAYLRKHGLRVSGNKAACVERILEHWRIKDRNAEKIYPVSSFCINCKGDVCTGDIILFKQRVYHKGRDGVKIIGKRRVAGRVVKESYGAVKQQHTFTIEVFWSKGVKKLPPLFPLLVKGRNLYRLMTFRQPWHKEAERLKVLEEKHERGAAARHARALAKARSAGRVSKRLREPSNKDLPPKRQRKEIIQAASGSIEANQFTQDKICPMETLSKGLPHKKHGKQTRPAASGQRNTMGNHAQFRRNTKIEHKNNQGRTMSSSASHTQFNHRNANQRQQPFFEIPRTLPSHQTSGILQPRANRGPIAAPAYFMGAPSDSSKVSYQAFDMPRGVHHLNAIPTSHFVPENARHWMPHAGFGSSHHDLSPTRQFGGHWW